MLFNLAKSFVKAGMIAIRARDQVDTELLDEKDDVLNEILPITEEKYDLVNCWK